MNRTKENLANKIAVLRVEIKTASDEDAYYIENEIMYLTEDLHTEFAKDCIAEGEHFRSTISEDGYDVCLNCGAKQ